MGMLFRGFIFFALLAAGALVPSSATETTAPNQDAEAGRILLRIFTPEEYQSSERVVSIAQGVDGAIYVGTAEGVSRFDGREWIFTRSPVVPVTGLKARADNKILVESREDTALLSFDLQTGTKIVPLENTTKPQPNLPLPQAVYPDSKGTLNYLMKSGLTARATARGGVDVPLPNGLSWQMNSLRGLSGRSVTCMLEDQNGGLWIGTDFGISRADLSSPVTLYLRRDGLERSPVRAIARINEQLVAAQNRGIYRLLPARIDERPVAVFEPLPNVWVQPSDLRSTPTNELIIASLVGDKTGLHVLDIEAGFMETLSAEPFHRLLPIPGSKHVLALGRGVIGYLQLTTEGWELTSARCERIAPGITTAWDEAGSLWIGDDSTGFARITPSTRGWPQHEASPMPLTRPPKETISINRLIQNRGAPLFLTESGLHHYDPENRRYVADRRNQLWADPAITPLTGMVQPDGQLWVQLRSKDQPRDSRLVRVNSNGDPNVSLPGNALEAVDFSSEGRLFYDHHKGLSAMWISGSSGLLRCDLTGLEMPFEPPPQPLVRLVDAPKPHGDDGAMRFTVYRGSLHFSYAVPDYRTGARWAYQTKLGDAKWSTPTNRTTTLLQDLPSGSYVWSVRAVNELGLPGPAREISFVLRDPWHRTWEAYALYLILVTTTVLLFVKWRLAESQREQQRLENLVQERTVAWQEAAARAETASQAKTVFLANASHELRTPLNAILGYTQLLENNPQLPDSTRKPVSTIKQSGQHLLRLISHVLDLAKFESGVTTGNPETINLRPFIEDIAVAHQIAAQKKGVALTVEIASDGPEQVIVDSLRLRQVFDNLIGNAVKFTTAGSIVISVQKDLGRHPPDNRYHRLTFLVRDTGPGISENDLDKIFEPFKQTATGEAEGRGTGLGLALAQRMVEMMGGQLTAESRLGEGSTFSFSLALAHRTSESGETAKPYARPTGYPGPRRRLLIVDDEDFNRHLLRDLLTPLGFEIDLASSAAELFARLTLQLPDAIILDLRMPGMSGSEAITRLRQEHPAKTLKIIAHSASIDATTRNKLSTIGSDAFLPKPFHEAELHAILAEILGLKWESKSATTT